MLSSESYKRAGLSQPKDVWPALCQFVYEFDKIDSAIAIELVLPLDRRVCQDPISAQEIIYRFVDKHLMVDNFYAQCNILLPSMFNDRLEEEQKSLGLCRAHILLSLVPMTGQYFSKMNENGLGLLNSVCPKTYPSLPGQYQVLDGGVITRWLTPKQIEQVWKQNAEGFPNILYETCEDQSPVSLKITSPKSEELACYISC